MMETKYYFFVETDSPDVMGGVLSGLMPLVVGEDSHMSTYVMLPEGPSFLRYPKGCFDSSAQGILWFVRIVESEEETSINPRVWERRCVASASERGTLIASVVDLLRTEGDVWRNRYAEGAGKTPWEGWSLPTPDRTKLILRHGYSSPVERFAIGVTRS